MAGNLASIREQVALYKGMRVKYRTSKGRRKIEEKQGVVLEVYPNRYLMWSLKTVRFRSVMQTTNKKWK